MATTLSIPLTTLSQGPHVYGPVAIPTGTTNAQILVDRNVGTAPIDGFPSTTDVLDLLVEVSLDNGATWGNEVAGTVMGGQIIPTKGPNAGVEQTTSSIYVSPISGDPASTTRQARGTVTANVTVSVSGSLTLS